MSQLILTAIGRDRTGLVAALADTVRFHGGNWEYSDMAEVAGTFAGVVQVSLPDGRVDAFIADLDKLDAELDVQVRIAGESLPFGDPVAIEVVADDRPGIVDEISRTLAAIGVSIARLETSTTPTPMTGGQLFRMRASITVPDGVERADVITALERLSGELVVDLVVSDTDSTRAR